MTFMHSGAFINLYLWAEYYALQLLHLLHQITVCIGMNYHSYKFFRYSPQFIHSQHVCLFKLLEWSLVEEKRECSGDEISKGRMISPGECASACNGIASMFAFGTNDFGIPRCDSNGCQCLCETAAADDGTCDSVQHKGYRLYRFRAVGK